MTKPQESVIECPFCGKMTITILHIPFVTNTFTSKCRAGGKNTIIQKERFDVLSGCEACGKSKKEVEKALNKGKQIPHEERLKRAKKSGLPVMIESIVEERDDD